MKKARVEEAKALIEKAQGEIPRHAIATMGEAMTIILDDLAPKTTAAPAGGAGGSGGAGAGGAAGGSSGGGGGS